MALPDHGPVPGSYAAEGVSDLGEDLALLVEGHDGGGDGWLRLQSNGLVVVVEHGQGSLSVKQHTQKRLFSSDTPETWL